MKCKTGGLGFRLNNRHYQLVACIVITLLSGASAYSQKVVMDLSGKDARAKTVQALKAVSQRQKEEAQALARAKGWPVRGTTPDNVTYELMKVKKGRPFYHITHNVNAAITTRTNLVRNTVPYNVNGAGLIAGVWDGENMRVTHREFGERAVIMDADGVWSSDHGTHVAGTIGAAGIDAAALGMAPSVNINYYAWGYDLAEMTSRAAAAPAQADSIYLSNHSYGWMTGWTVSGSTWYWFGILEEREDRGFGLYDEEASTWDDLCYNAPYYLPFKSAGNERTDDAPPAGTAFNYLEGGEWVSKPYDPLTDPYDDFFKGGYETIDHNGNAKNIMTVGAVDDAANGTGMAEFGSWGPTDDGRIKPDIVANGVDLYSCTANNTSSYGT